MPNKKTEDEKQVKRFNVKPIIITVVLLALAALIVWVLVVTNPYGNSSSGESIYGFSGMGTEKDPYLIQNVDDLCRFRERVNYGTDFSEKYFLQTNDLDLSEIDNWRPIGESLSGHYFRGIYNGDGHTISNLVSTDMYHSGLFGTLYGEVRNLGIESGYIDGDYVGAIASHGVSDASIINCYNKATVHGNFRAGGIADDFQGRIYYCWNLGEVTSDLEMAAGISSYNARIKNCYSYRTPLTVPNGFFGSMTESSVFDSYDEIDWMNELYTEQYNDVLKQDTYIELAKNIRFIVCGNDTVFFDRSFTPSCLNMTSLVLKNIQIVLSDYSAILLLAAAAVVIIIIVLCRPAARGTILTLLLICMGINMLNNTLKLKREDGNIVMQDYYQQPANSIDVLMIGSSRIGSNQDCEELWTNYGISSYDLWSSSQPAWNSYYYLNEALKLNTPKVVVLDVVAAQREVEYLSEGTQYANLDGMNFSLDKFEAIQASAPQESWLNLLFGFPIYHTRYLSLTKADFERYPWKAAAADKKGNYFFGGDRGIINRIADVSGLETVERIPKKQEDYLIKFIERCEEEGIPLVLVASVAPERVSYQPQFNYIAEIADEYDIPFINYNLLDEEMGFEVSDFYKDNVHLNINGARKQSAYLAKFLKENYDLPDHRGDPYYSSWDEFSIQQQNVYIPMITDRSDYLRELVRDGKTAVIIKRSIDESDPAYEAFKQDAAACGFDMSFLDSAGSGCWLVRRAGDPYEIAGYALNEKIGFQLDNEEMTIDPIDNEVSYADKKIAGISSGITCIVYDPNTEQIIDKSLIFDPSKSEVEEKEEPADPHLTISHI